MLRCLAEGEGAAVSIAHREAVLSRASCTVIELTVGDDLASLRQRLDLVRTRRVALVVPWDQESLTREIDFEVLRREVAGRGHETAIVAVDPGLRTLARSRDFPTFRTVAEARQATIWRSRSRKPVAPPSLPWWKERVEPRPRPAWPTPAWLRWIKIGLRVSVFLAALLVVAAVAYGIVPRAEITLLPAGQEFALILPVYADSEAEQVDETSRVVPARPVGIEIEGFTEVETTGRLEVALGKTTGEVLFTNLLFQDYVIPAGTVVRTSSTSYPIRFRTTEDLRLPAAGQAATAIESLADGVGNVAAYQINQVEGIAGSAVRVTNPQWTTGSDATEIRVVTGADRDRARALLMRQLLEDAHAELSSLDILSDSELVPRQSLVIQAVPKEAYTRFIGEQADTVGLEMRLLVSGFAVDAHDAEMVARAALSERLPQGYSLVKAWFEVGEVAEEDIGPGRFTIFITARGYGSAELNMERAIEGITGLPIDEARQQLMADLPLAQPPAITVWPEQVRRMPLLPLRIGVEVIPVTEAGDLASLPG